MPISHPLKTCFVHIPKCAGTSVEIALDIHGLDNKGDNSNFISSMLFGKETQHMTLWEILSYCSKHGMPIVDYNFFATVRCPVKRTYSAFINRRHWDKSLQFLSFDEFVEHKLEFFIARSKRFEFRHFMPQVDFLETICQKIKVDIFNIDKPYSLDALSEYIFKLNGNSLGAHNTAKKNNILDVSLPSRIKISSLYSRDFNLFGDYRCLT